MRTVSLILICCFLYGCASDTKPKRLPPTKARPLMCENGPMMLNIYGPEDASLLYESRTYNLKRATTASGVLYTNEDVNVWNKGLEYTVTIKDYTQDCSPAPEAIF